MGQQVWLVTVTLQFAAKTTTARVTVADPAVRSSSIIRLERKIDANSPLLLANIWTENVFPGVGFDVVGRITSSSTTTSFDVECRRI